MYKMFAHGWIKQQITQIRAETSVIRDRDLSGLELILTGSF